MKVYNILCIFVLVFVYCTIQVNAEMNVFSETYLNYQDNITNNYYAFQYEDTSLTGVGKNKPIELVLYYEVNPLPYLLNPYSGSVDNCNLTIYRDVNIWDYQGFLTNVTSYVESFYFSSNISADFGNIIYELKDRDALRASMSCHYTNNESLFAENVLVGRILFFYPAYECADCEKYTLEELSKETDFNLNNANDEVHNIENIQKVVRINYKILVYLNWIFKIFILMVSVSLIFIGIYWVYNLIRGLIK
jgi:hypothetical protein